jgi:chromosome segregation ATPase
MSDADAIEAEVQQDLRAALKAAKELIDSLREYSKNLATELDEAKASIQILKERLHESTKDPQDEKTEQKRKLAMWLKEAAEAKGVCLYRSVFL